MTDFDTYESRVIKLNNVMFNDTGAFVNGLTYVITDGTDNFNFRTTFYDVDYIDADIPLETGNIIAIPNARTDGNYITSRNDADLLFDGINPPESLIATEVPGMGVELRWNIIEQPTIRKSFVNENNEVVVVEGEVRAIELREADSWKVYRNDVMIAEADEELYLDPITTDGTYTYYVTAMYGDVESGPSNTATVIIGDPGDYLIEDSFESYPDFALEATPWTMVDGDLIGTNGIENVTFLNSGSQMAYIVFNPLMTTPPLTYEGYAAHTGVKYMASFAAYDGTPYYC